MKRSIPYVSVVVLLSILCQCSGLMSTKIGDIRNNPRRRSLPEKMLLYAITKDRAPTNR